jgi:hypothetical protein
VSNSTANGALCTADENLGITTLVVWLLMWQVTWGVTTFRTVRQPLVSADRPGGLLGCRLESGLEITGGAQRARSRGQIGHAGIEASREQRMLQMSPMPVQNSPQSRARAQNRVRHLTRGVVVVAAGATAVIGIVVAREHPGSSTVPPTSDTTTTTKAATGGSSNVNSNGSTTTTTTTSGSSSSGTSSSSNDHSSAPSSSSSSSTVTSGGTSR